MRKLYSVLLGAMLAILLAVGAWSLADEDQTISVTEKRELAARPKFSLGALLDGSFIEQFESYYSDNFPGREKLLGMNRSMNKFYYYSPPEQNYLVIDFKGGAEHGGEALHDVEAALAEGKGTAAPATPDDTAPDDTVPDVSAPAEQEKPDGEDAAPEPEQKPEQKPDSTSKPEPPDLDTPLDSEVVNDGSIIIVGDRAMDVPTPTWSIVDSYADTVNALNDALGPDVRTISLVTPNAAAFYAPESMRTGEHAQDKMIEYCYDKMDKSVITVDAYTPLRARTDEYIYFRTDHHWTALGAYYAYTAFCEAAGLEAAELSEFQTGTYQGFLGSMYTYTQGYPQSEALKENPDTLTYYQPKVETHAKYYSDATLSDGVPISVVYTKVAEDNSNKYLCFIGGDTPICIIETAVEDGPVCLMLKESYGNAFAPFLTSHYSKIVVVDPRKFNQDGMPSLDLKAFAAEQGVNDLIVLNYPFMISNSFYVKLLNRLIGREV